VISQIFAYFFIALAAAIATMVIVSAVILPWNRTNQLRRQARRMERDLRRNAQWLGDNLGDHDLAHRVDNAASRRKNQEDQTYNIRINEYNDLGTAFPRRVSNAIDDRLYRSNGGSK
jgi:hypothetical protein